MSNQKLSALTLGIFLIGVFSLALVSAPVGGFSGATNSQYYQPTFNQLYSGDIGSYWPALSYLENDQCEATSDFFVMIPPGGCSPMVVRSDLLAEQNVPVFCQLQAVQVNPLIKVSSIKSISFKGDYPEGVAGVTFHPARAATRSYKTLLGSPIVNNIGYVVIILKREQVEKDMVDQVVGNLTATIYYDAEEAYGVGQHEYYLPVQSRDDWEKDYVKNAFWKGKGFVRVEDVGNNRATVNLYADQDTVFRSVTVKEGETSGIIYFPGYYCRAGLRVKLNKIVTSDDSVLINVDGQETWAREGSSFLNGQCRVSNINIDKKENGGSSKIQTGNVKISCPGKTFTLKLGAKENGEGDGPKDESNENIDKNFSEGNKSLNELLENYPSVKKDELTDTYGEEALLEYIELAGAVGKLATQKALLEMFEEKYSNSKSIDVVRNMLQKFGEYNFSDSTTTIVINGKPYSIGISEFEPVDKTKKKVSLEVGSKVHSDLIEGGGFSFNNDKENITVVKINRDDVRLDYFSKNKIKSSYTKTIKEGSYGDLGGNSIYVKNIETEEYAYLSLVPEIQYTKTDAEFTFNIGVEKRAIELSPEKTEKLLKNINETIEKWEDINERLGNLVKAWKGACFATSTILMLKNAAGGLSGEGLARQKVMEKYKEMCDIYHHEISHTQCYNDFYPDAIKSDVEALAEGYVSVNEIMEDELKSGNHLSDGGLLSDGTVVDQEKYVNALKEKLSDDWPLVVDEVSLDKSDLTTSNHVRAALLYEKMENSDDVVAKEVAKSEFENALRNVAQVKKLVKEKNEAAERIKDIVGGDVSIEVRTLSSPDARFVQWDGRKYGDYSSLNLNDGRESGDKIQFFNYNGINYLLVLEGSELTGNMGIIESYKLSGNQWTKNSEENTPPAEFKKIVFVSAGSAASCNNPWPAGKAYVSYYETGTSKGLPAIVPFDLNRGLYVMVPNSAGTSLEDSPQGYYSSGALNYFSICSIGGNGLMERGTNDDICQTYNINTAGSIEDLSPCPGLDASEVKKIYIDAMNAVQDASRYYGSGSAIINGQPIKVGAPSGITNGLECQDFMSPSDCKLMFNVCDPVICPSSRCDLGGKMPVADVIQTGIVGGVLMCLPNAKEGIKVPICLSGIHAGLDSYTSILKSEADCLQRSLDTGQLVGICDEITSLYECQFFWKQAAPAMSLILPRLIEGATGSKQSARGGGEYLLVQSAFDNLDNSLNYFKNNYAPNAFRAFQYRNIQEVGDPICEAFVGTSFPTSARALDSLLEPESPPQFYAWFSEQTFTDATLPPTSQYNIYYHIYAGNDRGIQYRVYLKNPPQTSYYANSPTLNIKVGFIAAGDSADESLDMTLPEGYKELCVSIDARDYCGFKQVSSDVGLQLLEEKYVKNQIEKGDITSEKECISGSPSAIPLISPNIQDTVENSLNPDISLQGIVRVCANRNPDPSSGRWKDVGYCDESSLRCWLDSESTKGRLGTLQAVGNLSLKSLDENSGLINEEIATEKRILEILSKARKDIDKISEGELGSGAGEIIASLDEVKDVETAVSDRHKAEALTLKVILYKRIVEYLWRKGPFALVGGGAREEDAAAAVGGDDGTNQGGVPVAQEITLEEGAEGEININQNGAKTGFYLSPIAYPGVESTIYAVKQRKFFGDLVIGSVGALGNFCLNNLPNSLNGDDEEVVNILENSVVNPTTLEVSGQMAEQEYVCDGNLVEGTFLESLNFALDRVGITSRYDIFILSGGQRLNWGGYYLDYGAGEGYEVKKRVEWIDEVIGNVDSSGNICIDLEEREKDSTGNLKNLEENYRVTDFDFVRRNEGDVYDCGRFGGEVITLEKLAKGDWLAKPGVEEIYKIIEIKSDNGEIIIKLQQGEVTEPVTKVIRGEPSKKLIDWGYKKIREASQN